jgi:ribosomal subunit interface protein
MRINIKTTNIKLTPDVNAHLEKHLAGFEKFFLGGTEAAMADVELAKTTEHHHSGDIYKAEINIHIGGKAFRAVEVSGDILSAIDQAKNRMENELRANKDKKISLIRRGGQRVKAALKNVVWWKKDR